MVVLLVGHGIQTWAWSSLVSNSRSDESVLALVGHVLGRSIERRYGARVLPFGWSLLEGVKMGENAWVRRSVTCKGK